MNQPRKVFIILNKIIISQNNENYHYNNPDSHFYLGSLYEKLGDLQKARQSYEEALDLDPNHKGTLDALAIKDEGSPGLEMSRQVLVRTASKAPEGPAKKLTLIHEKLSLIHI